MIPVAYAAETTWKTCQYHVVPGDVGVPTLKCLEPVFARLLSISGGLALLAFFVMLIVAAIKFVTSGGDPKATESARNTIIYALIGIIVIVSAYIILKLLEAFFHIKLTEFVIPTP